MLDDEGALEPEGVELDMDKAEWFGQSLEHALAISEDEPMLKEALNSNESVAWSDSIEVELTQMEKVNA